MECNWLKMYKSDPDSWVISVKAKPRARCSSIIGISDDGMSISVALAAPPVDGEANNELVSLFSKEFKLRKNQIEILSGEGSRYKRVVLNGVSKEFLLGIVGVRH